MLWSEVRQGVEQTCQRPPPYGFPGQWVVGGCSGWRGQRATARYGLAAGFAHGLCRARGRGQVSMTAGALTAGAQQGAYHLRRPCPVPDGGPASHESPDNGRPAAWYGPAPAGR
jgi:hypothetical protein